ncbi:phage tail protein, partial [Clostridium algidicarnis]
MLQLYDLNKVKIQGLKQYKDMNIESILSTGDKTLSFLYPANLAKGIKEEGYIRTKTDEFVIKEITDNKEWKSIKATLNIEALEGQPWEHFDTTEKTITECLTLALAGTGWTIGTCSVTKRRTVRKTNCSSWDIIQQAKKTYLAEMQFDTINKKINISERLGSDKGVYFMDSLNLKSLDIQSNSYDYYTRLIAIGKDGLKVTVENYQYSNKKKTLIWKDERYTNIDSLKEDAKAKLEELSKPYKAYKADIIDLANISNKYSILAYGLGDTITLISKEKGIKEKQRIVKITEFPDDPSKNTCEIANTLLRFEDIQQEQQDTTDTVNNITTDNGT